MFSRRNGIPRVCACHPNQLITEVRDKNPKSSASMMSRVLMPMTMVLGCEREPCHNLIKVGFSQETDSEQAVSLQLDRRVLVLPCIHLPDDHIALRSPSLFFLIDLDDTIEQIHDGLTLLLGYD
jgi:hypothetical protein